MNIVIITGASSGIGKEFAKQMDKGFSNIQEFWLIARREEELEKLKQQLHHKVRVFPMDVTDPLMVGKLLHTVAAKKAIVRMLVNCAGYGIMGEFAKQAKEEEVGMIRVNCEALTALTHGLIPFMKERSRIIQIASSAAFLPQADFAVYAATKAYVLSFSRALNVELKKKGITVTAVCPGPVDTPFFDIAERNGSTLKIKKMTMVTSAEVVSKALRASYYKKDISVISLPINALWGFSKVLPHKWILTGCELLKALEKDTK